MIPYLLRGTRKTYSNLLETTKSMGNSEVSLYFREQHQRTNNVLQVLGGEKTLLQQHTSISAEPEKLKSISHICSSEGYNMK